MKRPLRVMMMMSGVAMGGAERNIVSVLPYIKKEGVEVLLCTLNKRRDSPLVNDLIRSGIERVDLHAHRMVDFRSISDFLGLIRKREIDIVHAEDQDTIIYGGLARTLLGVPVLMTRHVMEEPATSWKSSMRARLVLFSARYGVDKVIAVSEVVRKHFSKQAKIPLDKICTIYNGIEQDRFDINEHRDTLRLNLGWDINKPIAVFISVLRPGKGFDILFKAIPKITSILPDFQVKIIGAGELDEELRLQAAPLGKAVEFLGQRMDIPQLINASDLLIQASWSEALPTVLIEAGASAIPVVATDVGGTAEIVHDGKSGYLIGAGNVDGLADRVVKIFASPETMIQMGKYARDYVSKTFSLEKQSRETVDLYEDIISRKL
jgi:glycosyltransferase involved in cell wall biosynthesis